MVLPESRVRRDVMVLPESRVRRDVMVQNRKLQNKRENMCTCADLRVPDDQLRAVLRTTDDDMHAVRTPRDV